MNRLQYHRPSFELALALVLWAALATGPAFSGPLAVSPPPAKAYEAPLGEAYRAGIAALAEGKLDDAQRAFEQAVKADHRAPAPLLGLAEVAFQRKKPYDALARIKEAIDTDPNYSAAHAAMGRYLQITGKPKDAEASLRKAVQLDERAFRPRIDLADQLAGQGRWAEAVPLYEACIAIDPQHGGAHYALGLAYSQVGKADPSRAMLEQAARLDTKAPLPHIALARWHGGRKEYPQALAAVGEALKRGSKNLDALLLRGDLLDASGDAAAALGTYDEAAKSVPQSAAPQLRIAMLHHRTGQEAKALPAYLKVVDLEPKNGLALNNIADIYSRRKDGLNEAEQWAVKAVAAAPKAADAHDTLGWIQRAKGNLGAARASLEKANQLDPRSGETLYHLAQVYADQGDRAKARKTMQAAMKAPLAPASAEPARKLLAELGG